MDCDYLIIGSGIAGLSFALKASLLGRVVVVTKKDRVDTATNLAQGGIAAVLSKEDSPDMHIRDTLESGAGLCDQKIVELVVKNGAERIRELIAQGVNFVTKDGSSELDLGREGGHSRRRVAHAYDLTGREIERALLQAVKNQPDIVVLDEHVAVDLLMVRKKDGKKRCFGAYVLGPRGGIEAYRAKMTILCTGGCGKVYLYTSNPDISTGDGVAMAFRAGAKVTNMEFVQFHPTCLYHPRAKNFLISEAVRGEGAVLLDENGQRFMQKYDSRGELATRDTVARAIDKEMKERGLDCVYLDISMKERPFLQKRFPTIYGKCREYGIDISKEPIPVVPAAHYMCGGVLVDSHGRSSIDGLMVLGETANSGLHGGNRLASNSLLEAVVFADRAYRWCSKHSNELTKMPLAEVDPWSAGEAIDLEEEILIHHNWDSIRRIMWNYVGIVRKSKRLVLAKQRLSEMLNEIEQHYRDYYITANMVELRNISLVAILIVEAALARKESRGLHYTLDYPEVDNKQRWWNIFSRETVPATMERVKLVERRKVE